MFFVLSKTLDVFLSPLSWALCWLLFALWASRARRLEAVGPRPRLWPKVGTRLRRGVDRLAALSLPLSLGILLVFSLEPVSNALTRSLEVDAPNSDREGKVYDAVVLLGGLVEDRTDSHNGVAYNENVERLHGTYEVLAQGQAKFAILSGGSWASTIPEAKVLAEELARMGIAKERLIAEERSRNTRENAVYTAEIIRERGFRSILLVTSAFHMRRALRCFQVVGLEPDTMPVDYKSYDPARFSGSLLPRTRSLHDSSYALRELAGRVVYGLTGR